jgi:hypothetical protein
VNGESIYGLDPSSLKPVFPGRDGVVDATFEEVAQNIALAYDYFSSLPGSVLKTDQKKWRKKPIT